jgi:heat shock protein HslJ
MAPPKPEPEASEAATEPEGESTSRPERPLSNKALTPLADTQWRLIRLGGEEIIITPPQKPMTLAFSPEGRRIAGSAGCNSYLGTFNDDHGLLHLRPSDMTMVSCADPAGTREKKFVAILRSADGYKIDGDFLLLKSNGKTVAKFKTNPPF